MISTNSNPNCSSIAALLLTFRREEGLTQSLTSLFEAGVRKVYLAVDGPKNESDSATQDRIAHTVKNFCDDRGIQLHIWRRFENLGLSLSVLTALDWVFNKEEKVIVLEDDLEFDVDFVKFIANSLQIYEDDNDVWLISGNRFESHIVTGPKVSWATYPMIWGWASWSSRWPRMRDAILSEEISKPSRISLRSYFYWKTGLRRVNLGILNSWAVPLAAIIHLNGGFCLLPPVNLVSNTGVDEFAEHTRKSSWHSNAPRNSLPEKIIFSSENRKSISAQTDALFEKEIFRISIFNSYSYIASIIFDWFRFPKNARVAALSMRYKDFKTNSFEGTHPNQ
jgi:hypothetical protein